MTPDVVYHIGRRGATEFPTDAAQWIAGEVGEAYPLPAPPVSPIRSMGSGCPLLPPFFSISGTEHRMTSGGILWKKTLVVENFMSTKRH